MGIAAIYQELTIIPEMSVLSNAFLGKVPNRFFFTDKRRMERRFAELSRWMGLNISPHVNAGTLSIANQQMIEILRAVQTDENVLIMDEPTAPLGPNERARLYGLIGRLRENGVAIIFISHDLDEVLKLSDRVSVMREGQLVETRNASKWTKDTLVRAMLGDVQIVAGKKRSHATDEELLHVSKVGVARPAVRSFLRSPSRRDPRNCRTGRSRTHRGVALYRRGRALGRGVDALCRHGLPVATNHS